MGKTSRIGLLILVVGLITAPYSHPLAAAQKGKYQDYVAEDFEKAKDLKRVLFFYATWCSGCQNTHRQLQTSYIPDDVIIFKIDYDAATELRKAYGVPYQGTF